MAHLLGPSDSQSSRMAHSGTSGPAQTVGSVATLVCGLVAAVSGFIPGAHVVASWAGVIAFVGGLFVQYVSVTTTQRSMTVVGVVAGFLGGGLGIYHGGFMP